jgi:hypothetical protein
LSVSFYLFIYFRDTQGVPDEYPPGIMGKKRWSLSFTKMESFLFLLFFGGVKPSSLNTLCKSIYKYTMKMGPGFYNLVNKHLFFKSGLSWYIEKMSVGQLLSKHSVINPTMDKLSVGY